MAAPLSWRAEKEVQFILESCLIPCVTVTAISSMEAGRGSPQKGHARAAVPLRVILCISCLLEGRCWCESRRSSSTAKCTLISSCSQEGQSRWKTQRGVPRLNWMLISSAMLLMNCMHVGIILLLAALVSSGGFNTVNESGLSQAAVESAHGVCHGKGCVLTSALLTRIPGKSFPPHMGKHQFPRARAPLLPALC